MMLAIIVVAVISLLLLIAGAPFVPTHKKDMQTLFRELGPAEGRTFLDCGAGDGRVVAQAAQCGFRATGHEINPLVWLVARWRLRKFSNASVRLGLWQNQDISTYDVAYIFGTAQHVKRFTRNHRLPKTLVSYGFKPPELPAGSAVHQAGPFWIINAKS